MNLQTLGLLLSLWQTALTSLLSRKVVWAGRLRSSPWQGSFVHAGNTPIPKHSPSSCRQPLMPAVFRGASLQLVIPHSSSPRPPAAPWPQVAAGWPQLGTGLLHSSASATPSSPLLTGWAPPHPASVCHTPNSATIAVSAPATRLKNLPALGVTVSEYLWIWTSITLNECYMK